MTHARPLNLADPTNCRQCGGDGVACDWRNRHGEVDYELCRTCDGTGKRKPLKGAGTTGDCVAAMMVGGIIGVALFFMVMP